jgi:hypothetical protein
MLAASTALAERITFRLSVSASNPQMTALAYMSSSSSIGRSPKVRVAVVTCF